jgi:AmiR/NasT family two-component response regulator
LKNGSRPLFHVPTCHVPPKTLPSPIRHAICFLVSPEGGHAPSRMWQAWFSHETGMPTTNLCPPQRLVLVASDERWRKLWKQALEQQLGHRVVGEAGTETEMVRVALTRDADGVVLDLPHLHALDALAALHRVRPLAAVAILAPGERIGASWQAFPLACVNRPVSLDQLSEALGLARERFDDQCQLAETRESVRRAVQDPILIHQAKRLLMARQGLSEAEAHRRLQRCSMDRRIPLLKVAKDIISDAAFEGRRVGGPRREKVVS